MLNVPSSASSPRSTTSRPSSPSVFSRATGRIRNLYAGSFNDTIPSFDMLTPSNASVQLNPVGPPSRPQISRLAKSFADGITTSKLSDFLVWFLYYDVVELPETTQSWYAPLSSPDMRGWIAVGTFLAQLQAVDAEHGLDLVVLNSICDRARLPESLVHEILIRFASPKKMAYGILATTIRRAEQAHMAKLPMLVEVQAKLTAMNQFAGRLEPTKASVFAAWQLIVLKRIRGLLHLVIGPRIAHISEGKPLLTAATSQNLPREASEGIKLNYLFEVVQLERRVPFARYTGHNDNEPDFLEITSGQASNVVLRRENQELKEKVVSLAKEKSELEVKNRELAAKLERAVAAWDGFVGGTTTQEALLGASNSSSVYERALHPITLSSPSPALPERHPSQGMSHLQPDHADLRRQRRSGFIGLEELQGLGSDVAQAYVTGDETFVMSGRRDKAAEMLNGESSSE